MRVAIVTPWFGENLTGGAERLAWELAQGLSQRGERVTVFTTCAAAFSKPWDRNAHTPGESVAGHARLLRFSVDPANPRRFQEINGKLLAVSRARLHPGAPLLGEIELRDFVGNSINSTPLLTHLARRGDEYDAIVFLPYLYGLILRGWRVVRERAVIVPCLHDEVYAYLPPVSAMMRGAAKLIFNSVGSYGLGRRLYGPGIAPRSAVVGAGITWPEPETQQAQSAISGFMPETSRYMLYLGRSSAEKNVGFLTDAFNRYVEVEPETNLRLVIAGGGDRFPGAHITHVGHVDEEQKWRLLRNALALAQPSRNESYSRVMMEAWAAGRPVLVNADCASTTMPVVDTGGGWAARDTVEWIDAISEVDHASPVELAAIGAKAHDYVESTARWANVLSRYSGALAEVTAHAALAKPTERGVVHVLENAGYADSATLLALQYDALLRNAGVNSTVVAQSIDPRLGMRVRPFGDFAHGDELAVCYGAAVAAKANGRFALQDGKMTFQRSDGATVPFPAWLDLSAWNVEPTQEVLAPLVDGRTNILCVAPIAPASRTLQIVETFALYFTLDFDARLLLVGAATDETYLQRVRQVVERTGLEHRVIMPGEVSHPALAAMYRTAHLYVSMRETYETGLSFLEAAAHDIPICALSSPGARSILDTAGILVDANVSALALAALWRTMVKDPGTRRQVLESQRALASLSPEAVLAAFNRALATAGSA